MTDSFYKANLRITTFYMKAATTLNQLRPPTRTASKKAAEIDSQEDQQPGTSTSDADTLGDRIPSKKRKTPANRTPNKSPIKGRKAKAQQVAEWIERTQGQQLAFARVYEKDVSREYAFHDSKVMREVVWLVRNRQN